MMGLWWGQRSWRSGVGRGQHHRPRGWGIRDHSAMAGSGVIGLWVGSRGHMAVELW